MGEWEEGGGGGDKISWKSEGSRWTDRDGAVAISDIVMDGH